MFDPDLDDFRRKMDEGFDFKPIVRDLLKENPPPESPEDYALRKRTYVKNWRARNREKSRAYQQAYRDRKAAK